MSRIGQIYLGLMIVAGLVVGGLHGYLPNAPIWQLPPLLWLLIVSLVFDVLSNMRARDGGGPPLDMTSRIIGFLAGGAVSIILPRLMGAG